VSDPPPVLRNVCIICPRYGGVNDQIYIFRNQMDISLVSLGEQSALPRSYAPRRRHGGGTVHRKAGTLLLGYKRVPGPRLGTGEH
jgi:hypothetical protein